MSTNQDCVNARLIRFEFGASADMSDVPMNFPTPYYFAFVFMKGGIQHKEIFPSSNVGKAFELGYLSYIGQVLEKKEEYADKVSYYFSGGGRINFG